MAMLRLAVTRGYRNVAGLKKDSAFMSLRSREDFQQLLQELDARQKESGVRNQESDKKP
jgi:hypothetical protein